MDNLNKAKDILKKYNQEHLLSFYDELEDDKKEFLINQICRIDFDQIFSLYENSKIDEIIPQSVIEPLSYFDKSKMSKESARYYTIIGENCIRKNGFAVVTMAGRSRYKAWF